MKKINIYLFPLLAVVIFIASCTSTTRITSEPPGATVLIDGVVAGETPLVYEDSKISFEKTNIILQKEGYVDINSIIAKDDEVNVGAVVGGACLFWPLWLWTFEYEDQYHYVLAPIDGQGYLDVEKKLPDRKMEQINELNEMYKEGIIDQEEFEILKKRIMDGGSGD